MNYFVLTPQLATVIAQLIERRVVIERLLTPGSIPVHAMHRCVLGKDNDNSGRGRPSQAKDMANKAKKRCSRLVQLCRRTRVLVHAHAQTNSSAILTSVSQEKMLLLVFSYSLVYFFNALWAFNRWK